MSGVDYQRLLLAYIRHVKESEGIDFLGNRDGETGETTYHSTWCVHGLTQSEHNELMAQAKFSHESEESP